MLRAGGALPGPLGYSSLLQEPTGKVWRVVISHAGEQKRVFVDFLYEAFQERLPLVKVFLDEYSLPKGGDAPPTIHAALQDAFVGGSLQCCLLVEFSLHVSLSHGFDGCRSQRCRACAAMSLNRHIRCTLC